jgi:hypothetical protein
MVDGIITVEQDGKPYPTIIPEETEINFGPGGGENYTISVDATTNWTISIEQDGSWLTVPQYSNSSITFNCNAWSYYGTRYADVTLQGTDVTAHISVSQDGILTPYIMCADQVNFDYQCSGEIITIYVNSNVEWTDSSSGSVNWFRYETYSGTNERTITITCELDNNNNPNERIGYITLTGSGCTHQISVIQAADPY